MKIPDDLQATIDAEPKAKRMLAGLTEQNCFALAFRVHNLKTEAGRRRKIETFVEMLNRGETIYPQKKEWRAANEKRPPQRSFPVRQRPCRFSGWRACGPSPGHPGR